MLISSVISPKLGFGYLFSIFVCLIEFTQVGKVKTSIVEKTLAFMLYNVKIVEGYTKGQFRLKLQQLT